MRLVHSEERFSLGNAELRFRAGFSNVLHRLDFDPPLGATLT
jgi:hypothetical protein